MLSEEIREGHTESVFGSRCAQCRELYPCAAKRAADALDALREERVLFCPEGHAVAPDPKTTEPECLTCGVTTKLDALRGALEIATANIPQAVWQELLPAAREKIAAALEATR